MRNPLLTTAAICFAMADAPTGAPRQAPRPRRQRDDDDEELPRYRLTQRAYFDRVYEAGDEVETELVPGPHMAPLNDLARAMADRAPKGYDPTRTLNSVPRFQSNSAEDLLAGLLSRLTAAPPAAETQAA